MGTIQTHNGAMKEKMPNDNKWDPKCKQGEQMYFSAQGYLLPCCLFERTSLFELHASHYLFDEELKLQNNENIEEIVLSDQWIKFNKSLESVETAPDRCKQFCNRERAPSFENILKITKY